MKKVLLLIISLLLSQAVLAYETVLIDFPQNQGWHADYYEKQGTETILQYVPAGQTARNWNRTLVFHSYKYVSWTNSAAEFLDRLTMQMENQNSSGLYKCLKHKYNDSIAVRCVKGNKIVPTQCEIYRVAKSYEGLISMHYINKNVSDFKNTYDTWYNLMQDIMIYRSYYREDRVMDKASSYEL